MITDRQLLMALAGHTEWAEDTRDEAKQQAGTKAGTHNFVMSSEAFEDLKRPVRIFGLNVAIDDSLDTVIEVRLK